MNRLVAGALLSFLVAIASGGCGKGDDKDTSGTDLPGSANRQTEAVSTMGKDIVDQASDEIKETADTAISQVGTMKDQAIETVREMGEEQIGSLAEVAKEAIPDMPATSETVGEDTEGKKAVKSLIDKKAKDLKSVTSF